MWGWGNNRGCGQGSRRGAGAGLANAGGRGKGRKYGAEPGLPDLKVDGRLREPRGGIESGYFAVRNRVGEMDAAIEEGRKEAVRYISNPRFCR